MDRFDKRVIRSPSYSSWCSIDDVSMSGVSRYNGVITYDGLSDADKLCLYVYAWNKIDLLPRKVGILRQFGWTNYRLQKIIKSLGGQIIAEPTFNECTGMLNGRGYKYYEK